MRGNKLEREETKSSYKYSRTPLIRTSQLRAPQSTGQLLHQAQLLSCVIAQAHVLCTLNYSTCDKNEKKTAV